MKYSTKAKHYAPKKGRGGWSLPYSTNEPHGRRDYRGRNKRAPLASFAAATRAVVSLLTLARLRAQLQRRLG